ncbi:MAG TPA: CDP-archaeol synthase [Vicinamibacterales bacterium]|nr:CDP-archaeol synthase [Vicinamibacterales bacterium]
MTRALDPLGCAGFLVIAFAVAGCAQAAWLGSAASRRYGWPIDGGLTFRGRRIFGSNKTVRGFLVMPLATGLSFLLVSMATAGRMSGLWPLQPLEYAALGLLAGAGFMAGELPNSFVKRQLGIAPGAPAQGMVLRPVCSLLDRLDSPLGALAALALVVPVPPLTILYVLAIGPFLHGAFSVATFRLGGKERAA